MRTEPRLLWGLPRMAWLAFGLLLLATLLAALRTLIQPTLERPLYHGAGLLFFAGLFGPGLLREFGLLRDQDELQLQAARRAGWRAFLYGGAALLLLAHFMPWSDLPDFGGRELPKLPLNSVLLVMLVTYVCSYLQDYWGARRGATAVLAVMAVLMAFGALLDEWPRFWHILVDLRLSAGFLLAILILRRYPQVAGIFLVALALLFMLNLQVADPILRFSLAPLLVAPPLILGTALIRDREEA